MQVQTTLSNLLFLSEGGKEQTPRDYVIMQCDDGSHRKMFITNNEIFVAMKKMHENYLHFLQKEYDYLKTKEIEMAKKTACNCNNVTEDEDEDLLYIVYDDAQGEIIANAVEFDDIEDEVSKYLDENEYTEEDVDIMVYKQCGILVEIISKPKILVKRN